MNRKGSAAKSHRPRLLVLSGPPCSGKSTLAKKFEERHGGLLLEMDEIRKEVFPSGEQTKRERNLAYRAMFREARRALLEGKADPIILVATFAPIEHRQELVAIADASAAEVFLVECLVPPEEAVRRFRQGREGHAAIDLTEARVREHAHSFPFYGGGLLLDTGLLREDEGVAKIAAFLSAGPPMWSGATWGSSTPVGSASHEANAATTTMEHGPIEDKADSPPLKISSRSRGTALVRILIAGMLWRMSVLAGFVGLALTVKAVWSEWRECGPIRWPLVLPHGPCEFAPDEALGWVQVLTGVAILAAGVLPLWEFLAKPQLEQARLVRRAGKEPRFGPVRVVERTNREIFDEYRSRLVEAEKARMPLEGIPLYFLVPPVRGGFNVFVKRGAPPDGQKDVVREAAEAGFDWQAYSRWQLRSRKADYYGKSQWEKSLAVSKVSDCSSQRVEVTGHQVPYYEYLCREQRVHLEIPGQLPYLRAFFEGPAWYGGGLQLVDLDSSWRYSRVVSTCCLITTEDRYLLLQRRSAFVGAAAGGMVGSAAGFAKWSDVDDAVLMRLFRRMPLFRRQPDPVSLAEAALREIREELGLTARDFDLDKDTRPFLAAAFNLRYGRDLNFYAHLHFKRASTELSHVFARPPGIVDSSLTLVTRRLKDRWEIAHLVFVPLAAVQDLDGQLSPPFNDVLGDARHVRGALYALAKSGRLADVKERLRC